MTKKIGIVCSGGGMTCAYSCGALEALYQHYNFTQPDVLIGASGSAGNCAYFAAGQIEVGREIWCNQISDGQMISWRRWPILNIDYLVNTVFKKRVPLNLKALQASPIHVLIPATSMETGRTTYFSNHDSNLDFFRVLQAAKSIPFIAGKSVALTPLHTYSDGDFGQKLLQHLAVAEQHDIDTIILIDNSKPHTFILRCITKIMHWPQRRSALISKHSPSNPTNSGMIALRPSQSLDMNPLTDTKVKVARAYNMGYQDAVNHPALQTLFRK